MHVQCEGTRGKEKGRALGYGEYSYHYYRYVFCALMMSVLIQYIQIFIQYIGISISYEKQEVIGHRYQWQKTVIVHP